MIEFVWEYTIHPDKRGLFELVFGPGGAWSQAFAAAEGYRGTSVMRDSDNGDRYMLVDVWDSPEDFERATTENAAAYATLQTTLAEITTERHLHGTFQLLQQASVRPNPKDKRGRTGRRRG